MLQNRDTKKFNLLGAQWFERERESVNESERAPALMKLVNQRYKVIS